MAERYSIRVTKDHLVFCAGHYITYDGTECERLHGHNYRVAVELDALLDPNHYVFDFIALKDRTRELINELDHRMLLAVRNPILRVDADDVRVRVRYVQGTRSKEWIFPVEDCVLLPIENTTAERLAKYLADRLTDVLLRQHGFTPTRIRVDVDESFGQTGTYERTVS